MDSRKSTSQQRRRPPRPPLSSSSSSLDDDSQDDAGVAVQPRRLRRSSRPPATTPRTKRRSIAQLSELVRRQKEQQRCVPSDSDPEDHIMEAKRHRHEDPSIESTAAHSKQPQQQPQQQRLIQVAVRCRPRVSSQRRYHSENDDDDEEEEMNSDNDPSDDDTPLVSDDSVVEYEIPTTSSSTTTMTPLPVVSVPSHVLALGGHGPRRRFAFDYVFPPGNAQRDVYDACARDAIDGVLRTATGTDHDEKEAHATIVAYGQTGTGKTYTMGMLQHADPHTEERDHGIIPRAILHILSRIADVNCSSQGVRLEASISFLQIYLESIQDLLAPAAPATNATTGSGPGRQAVGLQVRLDPAANVFHVPGLSEFRINHIDDARALLERAAHNRVLAATARNKTSSRSHTLLTVTIRQLEEEERSCSTGSTNTATAPTPRSTVSFVDLAGSERVEGALHFLHATRRRQELRIREAKFINRSLSALGSVIAALATQEDTNKTKSGHTRRHRHHQIVAPHIRFRDSQLTKLLQSRLMHGNGRLVLIATIDDRAANLTETLSTLKFASQCRRVDLRRRGSAAQSDDALRRRKRQEEQLQQAVAAVKIEYEQREAVLQQEYETRLAALNEELQQVNKNKTKSSAPYVALCSLADIAQQQHGAVSRHPLIESFRDESDVVAYTATLYDQVRTALLCGGGVPHRTTAITTERIKQSAIRDDERPPSAPAIAPAPVKAANTEAVRKSDKPPLGSHANEAEFQAIARWLFASGALQTLDVSSDEDEVDDHTATFSQLP